MIDFKKFKPRLKEYLRQKGVDDSISPTHCFNVEGHKHSDSNPSCQIWDDGYKCHGCGIQGDIYDAVELLEGITGKKEQYDFIEKLFDDGRITSSFLSVPTNEEFEPDTDAMRQFENYLSSNPKSEQMIKQFLNSRAYISTDGKVQSYPDCMIPALLKYFLYWPGLNIALIELHKDILKKAGIPLVNPQKGYSTWEHSGVIVKLGCGYKLHYYKDNECKKINSKSGTVFPMPGIIDKTKPVILVEGEMDAISTSAIGIENIFSTGGTNGLTSPKIKKYLLEVPEIILSFDADESGRKASGLVPMDAKDKRKTNIPQIILESGYTGKIKIAEIPLDCGYKDHDALILAGKQDIIIKAIAEAKDYVPIESKPQPKKAAAKGTIWEAYESISIERLKDLLGKIPRKVLDNEDIQPFVSSCVKACKHRNAKQELLKWEATIEEIDAQNDCSPYFLLEACDKYGVSKYLKKELEKALVPASEMLKTIKYQNVNVKINYEKIAKSDTVKQLLATHGVQSAAQVVYEVLDGNVVYSKSENEFYSFNGHIWEYESNMTGIVYTIICSIVRYCLQHKIAERGGLWDLRVKSEGRRFRVETVQDFAELHSIHRIDINFDSPSIKETLTLSDGVLDFSGSNIVYRASKREEFRRNFLPYSIEDIKKGTTKSFYNFINGNFRNEKTRETLMYYLSLIASRNTQFKYGGVFIGKRHTGKTTLVELLRRVYPGMLDTIPPAILVTQGRRHDTGNEATPYIAALEGKGAGVASETEKGGLLNNALFKLLTGGDTLIARGLYKAPRSFIPTAQIIICTNHSPRFDAQDSATIDRMVIIPFSVEHNKGDKETKSQDLIINSLRPEFAGIIRVLAEYYIKLRIEFDGAIPFSDECLNYKNNYVDEQRTDLDKFVSDNIEFGLSGDNYEKVEDLYNRFLLYYDIAPEDAEKEALPRKKFTYLLRRDFLEMKNYKQKKIGGKPIACFFGIKLKPFDEVADRPSPQGYFDKETGDFPKRKRKINEFEQQSELERNPFE